MRFRVRKAQIAPDLRVQLERFGETIVAQAVGTAPTGLYGGPLYGLVQTNFQGVLDWLTERSDIRERHETRIEILEWAILVFVIVGVIVESGLGAWIAGKLL